MWWRLGVLGAITAALLFCILAPMATVSVTVDLPPLRPGDRPVSTGQIQTFALGSIWITEAIVVAVILAVAGIIAWRIVRRYRTSN